MRPILCASLLSICLPVSAQIPASSPAQSTKSAKTAAPPVSARATAEPPGVMDRKIGFSYSLPEDWKFEAPPRTPTVIVPYPNAVAQRKGDACVEVVLSAKRGAPVSSVVVTELPFSCYGQTVAPAALADLGAGAAEGLKQTFDIVDPVLAQYKLGSYSVWIERAKGAPKGHGGDSYTFESACTILTKGIVCWTAMAADAASLRAFEKTPVSLEGRDFAALVPADVFLKKP